jgi:Protein of unknown function (DUF4238)
MSTPAPNLARRHHTVPKFYLRGFARDEQIATVGLPGNRRFVQSIGDAAVGKDFYSVEGHEDGDDFIEKALSEIEGAAAAVFKVIAAGQWPLSPEDRTTLGFYVALQAARVPVRRRTIDHMAAQMMRLQIGAGGKELLRKQFEEKSGEISDDQLERMWAQATRPEGPPVQRPKVEHIQQMLETAQTMLKYVVGRPWSLVQFDRRCLITCDSPVGLVPEPNDEPWRGVGYLTAWGITFPLTRKLGLLMGSPQAFIDAGIAVERVQHGEADLVRFGTTALEKFFNFSTVATASEWLFHHPDDASFVPAELPDPRPVTLRMQGNAIEFTGEPWYKTKTKNKPAEPGR